MKKVIMTYEVEFEDEVPDEICYSSALEVMQQDRHWPNDDQIRIEHIPNDPR